MTMKFSHKPKIILFNGPPRCGKDTLANYVSDHLNREGDARAKAIKFAQPLKDAVQAFYGINPLDWISYDDQLKDTPDDKFLGKTSRECQIGMSEVYAKVFHDDLKVFGKICANKILSDDTGTNLYCVSDSGFVPEAEHLVEVFGKENILLLHIVRSGTSFEGDSRNWVDLSHVGVTSRTIDNNETVESAVLQIFNEMNKKWT